MSKKYTLSIKDSSEVNKMFKKAEKNELFKDLICDNCGKAFDIDWRKQTFNLKGLWYYCPKCDWNNVIGWDVIEETAKQKLN